MNIIDITKLETAITYIKRMTEGNHPVTNLAVEEDSVINNPNVIRCMYFVQDVLEKVYMNEGVIGGRKKIGKEPFPFEIMRGYRYEKDKSISHIMHQIRDMVDNPNIKMIGYKSVTDWLKASGCLKEDIDIYTGKKVTKVTERGKKLGIYEENRTSQRGDVYHVIMYNKQSQEFLAENIEKIINGEIVDLEM